MRIPPFFIFCFFFVLNSCTSDSEETQLDTTPPEMQISFLGISDSTSDEIIAIGRSITIDIEASDEGGLQKVVASIDGAKVAEDTEAPYQLFINLSSFSSKSDAFKSEYKLKIEAVDIAGNVKSIEKTIIVRKELVKLNIPPTYYLSEWDRHFVFASDMEGNLLDIVRVFPNTQEITLYVNPEIPLDFDYMLTMGMYQSTQGFSGSNLVTVANLNGFVEINLKPTVQIFHMDGINVPAIGFDSQDVFNSTGGGRLGGGFLSQDNETFSIYRNKDISSGIRPNQLYIDLYNVSLNTYSYTVLDWEINDITEINRAMFVQDGIENLLLTSDYLDDNDAHKSLSMIGFLDEEAFQNNIWSVYGTPLNRINNEYSYIYNSSFYKHIYSLTLDNYNVLAHGRPDNHYARLDWNIEYTYQDNEIGITTSPGNHTVGNILLTDNTNGGYDVNGKRVNYYWELIFDSQKQTSIKLPQIPEELQIWEFYPFYEQNSLDFNQVKISRYDGILNYEDFLNKIIKEDESRFLNSSRIESIYKSISGNYNSYLESATLPLTRD